MPEERTDEMRYTLEQDDEGDWIARVVGTPALIHGATPDEAIRKVQEVHADWKRWESEGFGATSPARSAVSEPPPDPLLKLMNTVPFHGALVPPTGPYMLVSDVMKFRAAVSESPVSKP